MGETVTYAYPYQTTNQNYQVALYLDDVSNPCNTQQVAIKAAPDPAIGLVPTCSSPGTLMVGDAIKTCQRSASTTIAIFNNSSTYEDDQYYEIDWGDGIIESYNTATFSPTAFITHEYTTLGYKIIAVKSVHVNGCYRIKHYVFYSSSNPSVEIG